MILLFLLYLTGVLCDYAQMAGYTPVSNVVTHSKIDLDLRDLKTELNEYDWSEVLDVYSNGKNSVKSSGAIRTLKGFSTSAPNKMIAQPYYQLYSSYWNDTLYADNFILNTLNDNTYDNVTKVELVMKGAQYQNLWMYVIHEMEDAVQDCLKGDLTLNDGGPHAWDEAWAFYTGSLEDGTGSGFAGYALAEKRCKNFGTCGDRISRVNERMLDLFKEGSGRLRMWDCNSVYKVKNNIVKYSTIPLIQGLLRYVYKSDPNGGNGKSKEIAEGCIFARSVLPQISYCDRNVADIVEANMHHDLLVPVKDGYRFVKNQIESVYRCLNITCSDVGGLLAYDTVYFDGMEPCDDNIVNPINKNLLVGEIVGIVVGGIVGVILIVVVLYYRKNYLHMKYKYNEVIVSTRTNVELPENGV